MCFILSINGIRHLGDRGKKCTPVLLKWFSEKCECTESQASAKCELVCASCAKCIAKDVSQVGDKSCDVCKKGKQSYPV